MCKKEAKVNAVGESNGLFAQVEYIQNAKKKLNIPFAIWMQGVGDTWMGKCRFVTNCYLSIQSQLHTVCF